MRNAGLILGIIAGLVGMLVGFFGAGYTVFVDWISAEVDGAQTLFAQVENVELVRIAGLIAPILAIAGGAMAHSQRWVGGGLMLASALGMAFAFGFGVFTMFPIAMAGLGGVLVLGAPGADVAK